MKAGRKHSRFPNISANSLHHLKRKQLKSWVKQKHAKHVQKLKISPTTSENKGSDSEESLEGDSETEGISDVEGSDNISS